MSTSQFLVQNYSQIIDLFENLDENVKIAVSIECETPVSYLFMSKEQLDNAAVNTLPTTTAYSISKIVGLDQRYLLVKAEVPTVMNVTRTITSSSRIAEFFSYKMPQYTTRMWYFLIVLALLIIIGATYLFMHFKKSGIKFQSPINQAYKAHKSGYSPVSAFYKTLKTDARAFGKRFTQ